MTGQDLEIQQNNAYNSMERSKDEALHHESVCLEKTRDYEIALAQRMYELREQGYANSILEKLAKGEPYIAQIKYEAGMAEALAKAAKENINIKKRAFDSLEATKKRELG